MIVWVYALVESGGRPVRTVTGIRGEHLRVVRTDRIAAIVGDLARRPAASTLNLRRYAAVVEVIASRVPAILPARFGTTFDDVRELTFVLRSHGPGIRRRLRAVRGRAQMTIRLLSDSESGDDLISSQSCAASRARVRLEHKATQGTQYLQQRLAITRRAREIPELAPMRGAIQRLVKEERVERRAGIATAHHLVPRRLTEQYRAGLIRLAEQHGVRLAISGPWAPYAFADNW